MSERIGRSFIQGGVYREGYSPRGEMVPESASDSEVRRQFHIEKLRELRPFFQVARSKPHLWDQVVARHEKRDDFLRFTADDSREDDLLEAGELNSENRIRTLVPLLSAAATVPELRTFLQASLDRASKRESERLLEAVSSGHHDVDFLVVGASIHGAKFNTSLKAANPSASSLTVDSRSVLGGHWRDYKEAVLRMNTENAAINEDVPGQVDNVHNNSFGHYAPVQLPELTGDLHADTEMMGLATALNQYLSCNTILETEVTKIAINTDSDKSSRALRVELQTEQDSSPLHVYADWITLASGLGISDYGLRNPDEETERIVDMYGASETNHQKRRIELYDQFLRGWGDETNIFPRDKYKDKRVMVVGGGHSGWTVIQNLIGDGPQSRGSVASLGGPDKIIVAGSKYESSEEFRNEELEVYAAVARVYPSNTFDGNGRSSLVEPLKGAKVFKIEQKSSLDGEKPGDTDPFIVSFTVPERVIENGKEIVRSVVETRVVDNIIFTTGFKSKTQELVRDFLGQSRAIHIGEDFELDGQSEPMEITFQDQPLLESDFDYLSVIKGAAFTFSEKSDTKHIEILGVEGKRDRMMVSVRFNRRDGVVSEHQYGQAELRDLLKEQNGLLKRITLPPIERFPDHLPFFYDSEDTVHPIGRYVPGTEKRVICVGPAAGLASDERELRRATEYRTTANAVAIVNTFQDTGRCAEIVGGVCREIRKSTPIDEVRELRLPPTEIVALPPVDITSESDFSYVLNVSPDVVSDGVVAKADYEELLRTHLRGELMNFELPKELDSLSFSVTREVNHEDGSFVGFYFTSDISLPDEYKSLIKKLFKDTVAKKLLYRLTDKKYAASNEYSITLPRVTPLKKKGIEV